MSCSPSWRLVSWKSKLSQAWPELLGPRGVAVAEAAQRAEEPVEVAAEPAWITLFMLIVATGRG